MGIALIVVGLLAAATVVDFILENDLAAAPERSFALFGGSFTFDDNQVVLGAALLGAVAVALIGLGGWLSRGTLGRRRARRRRFAELERGNAELARENAELRATRSVVRVEPTWEPEQPEPDEVRQT
jgi:hypothetical protein